jgi:hypothetical protein
MPGQVTTHLNPESVKRALALFSRLGLLPDQQPARAPEPEEVAHLKGLVKAAERELRWNEEKRQEAERAQREAEARAEVAERALAKWRPAGTGARQAEQLYPRWRAGQEVPGEWVEAVGMLPGAQAEAAHLLLTRKFSRKTWQEALSSVLGWLRTHPEDRGECPLSEGQVRRIRNAVAAADRPKDGAQAFGDTWAKTRAAMEGGYR